MTDHLTRTLNARNVVRAQNGASVRPAKERVASCLIFLGAVIVTAMAGSITVRLDARLSNERINDKITFTARDSSSA